MKTEKTKVYNAGQCGGPCSGKTTGMSHMIEFAKGMGMHVLIVPEAATLYFGMLFPKDKQTQRGIFDLQIRNEDFVRKRAESLVNETNTSVLVIHDRTILDGLAYADDPDAFMRMLYNSGYTESHIFEKHYDVVTHLVTAADGAEEYYTLANNAVRKETPEEARAVDHKLQHIWRGNPHFEIIGNRNPDGTARTFEEKMRVNTQAVFGRLGFPVPIENERRWEVEIRHSIRKLLSDAGIEYHMCRYEQTYLQTRDPKREERVRMKRYEDGVYMFHTTKTSIGPGKSFETDPLIGSRRYNQLLCKRDPGKHTIVKNRYSFIYEKQVFSIDEYIEPEVAYRKLELEGTNIENVALPGFLPIIKEVTGLDEYRDKNVARKKIAA